MEGVELQLRGVELQLRGWSFSCSSIYSVSFVLGMLYQNEGHFQCVVVPLFFPSSSKRISGLGSVLQSLSKKPKISTLVGKDSSLAR